MTKKNFWTFVVVAVILVVVVNLWMNKPSVSVSAGAHL